MKKLILALLILLLLLPYVSAKEFQVGVSPPVLDMGDIQRGDSRLATFSLVTSSSDKFLVRMDVRNGVKDFFNNRRDMMDYYSEEDASSWVEFIRNPVAIESEHESSSIKRWEDIDFIVNVPPDAEPGYHIFVIEPVPYVPSETGATGVAMVAATKITVIFNIPGETIRSGNILDVTSKNMGNRIRVNTIFHNNGTVSMTSRADEIRIYHKNGTLLKSLASYIAQVKPGNTVELGAFLDRKEIFPGKYDVSVKVGYLTGQVTKETTLYVAATGAAVTAAPAGPEGAVPVSLWYYFIPVILFVSYLIYNRR